MLEICCLKLRVRSNFLIETDLISDEDIRELFPGEIINIEIVRPKKWQFSHAFLTFTKFADALWVVENINGASVCGGVVRVEFLKKERK